MNCRQKAEQNERMKDQENQEKTAIAYFVLGSVIYATSERLEGPSMSRNRAMLQRR